MASLRCASIPTTTALLLATLSLCMAEEPPGSQLGRVKIATHHLGKTVVTSTGQLLRGTSVLVYAYGRSTGKTAFIYDDAYWQTLQDNGVNAVRLACFDAWQRAHGAEGTSVPYPHADLNNAADVEAMLKDYDQVVNAAGRHGLYVLLNYHNTGGYRDPDYEALADQSAKFPYLDTTKYISHFWQLVAPRYRDRTHVFYELMNEPVQWWPENYTTQVLDDIRILFDQVRAAAPQTHLVLVSCANHMTWKPEEGTLLGVARQLRERGVDFSNASIGFHAYNLKYPKPNEGEPIVELMQEFPVINTEANLPKALNSTPNDPDGSGFNGDEFGVQSMERMKISWFHWKTSSPEDVQRTWLGLLLPDAREKGYYWGE